MSVAYNPLSGNFETKEPGPQGPAGTVSAAGDGSQGTPSISFASDTNTGLYKYAADSIGVSTGGTNRLVIDSSGRIGFGVTTMAGGASDVTILRNSALRWADNDGTQRADIYGDSNSNIVFRNGTGSTERMRINSGGLVNITGGIQVTENVTPASGSGVEIFSPSSTIGQVQAFDRTGNGWMNLIIKGANTQFFANGSERMRIDSSGRLLVGTTSAPAGTDAQYSKLAVRSNTLNDNAAYLSLGNNKTTTNTTSDDNLGIITFNDNDSDAGEYARITGATDGANGTNDYPGKLIFSTTADGAATPTERMRIDSSGNVGIGVSPGTKFQVRGDNNLNVCIIDAQGTAPNYILDVRDDGTSKFRVDGSGNVGIGVTSPQTRLHTAGTTNGAQATFGTSSSGLKISTFQKTDNDAGVILDAQQTSNGTLTFATGGSEAMRIDGTGKVGIGETSMDALLVIKGNSDANTTPSIRLKDGNDSREAWITNTSGDLILANGGSDNVPHCYLKMFDGNVMTFATANAERMRIDSSGRLLVGTSSSISGADANALVQASHSSGAKMCLGTSDSTVASGQRIGDILFQTNAGGSYASTAIIQCAADAAQGTGDYPSRLTFSTTSDGASSPTERLRITSGGVIKHIGSASGDETNKLARYVVPSHDTNEEDVIIFQVENESTFNQITFGGGTSSYNAATQIVFRTASAVDTVTGSEAARFDSSGRLLVGTTSSTDAGVVFKNTQQVSLKLDNTDSSPVGLQIRYGTDVNNTANKFIDCIGNATSRFIVNSNGDCKNTNNSFGAISDAKLKENIVDASSQWDDIKDIRVRNYNLIENPTRRQIGVVAQEIETVSPGLVTESPDLDAEGNDLGTTTKSVNYSVLYMKAVKALQEAMDRIETLEAKVAALEAG